jgi:hypothetical protein
VAPTPCRQRHRAPFRLDPSGWATGASSVIGSTSGSTADPPESTSRRFLSGSGAETMGYKPTGEEAVGGSALPAQNPAPPPPGSHDKGPRVVLEQPPGELAPGPTGSSRHPNYPAGRKWERHEGLECHRHAGGRQRVPVAQRSCSGGRSSRVGHRPGSTSAASIPVSSACPIPSPVSESVAPAASPAKRTGPWSSTAELIRAGIGHAEWRPSGVALSPRTSRIAGRSSRPDQMAPVSPMGTLPPLSIPKPTFARLPGSGKLHAYPGSRSGWNQTWRSAAAGATSATYWRKACHSPRSPPRRGPGTCGLATHMPSAATTAPAFNRPCHPCPGLPRPPSIRMPVMEQFSRHSSPPTRRSISAASRSARGHDGGKLALASSGVWKLILLPEWRCRRPTDRLPVGMLPGSGRAAHRAAAPAWSGLTTALVPRERWPFVGEHARRSGQLWRGGCCGALPQPTPTIYDGSRFAAQLTSDSFTARSTRYTGRSS